MNEKNCMWSVDIDTVIEIYELAKAHGKKTGESMQEEFDEILKKKKEKFQLLGTTDKDIDLLTGDMRENGANVINIAEINRRFEND